MTRARSARLLRRLLAACAVLGLAAVPSSADTVTKTWTFAAGAESFAATTGGQSTAAWDGGTGNPAGALYSEVTGRNRSNTNYWEWTGTFEALGVPAGATVSAVQLVGGFTRCTVYTSGSASTAGPWEVRNAAGDTVLATLYTGRTFTAVDPAWVAATGAIQALGALASNTTIRVRVNETLATVNAGNAVVRLYDDQVSIQITYTLVSNTPPTVTITAPADASTFDEGQSIGFTGTASDTEDGDLTASLSWTSSIDGAIGSGGSFSRGDLSVGTHTITASVTDSGGLSGDDSITVTVNNVAPTVTITAPPDASSFVEGANVTFTGTASDPGDGNLTASLAWNSSLDGPIGTGGSFSRSDLSVGTHTITASVTDSNSAPGQDQITITIDANTPPTATITAPPDASGYNQGDTVNFAGTATDAEDGTLTASLAWTSSLDGAIGTGGSFSRSDLSPGTHTITASVTDSGGLTDQDQITITVNGPPTVTITAPTGGASYNQGDTVSFTGTATDVEDGTLTASLAWTSSIDGAIGTGGSFSRSDLSVGTHTITASVTDSGGLTGQDQVSITINAVANDTTPGTPTANIDACNQITITAPFSGDDDGDGTTLFLRSPNGVDSWAPVTSCGASDGVVGGAGPRVCIDTTVADDSVNHYRVDFSDPDGVNPPDPQDIGPFDTTPFCAEAGTTVGTAEAEAASCSQITVLARFTGDADLDGSTLVEISPAGAGTWTSACAEVSGPSPRACAIPGLDPSTSYDLRLTFSDPDGVAPDANLDDNSEQITPSPATVATTACGTDTAAPTVWFLAPSRDAILGGTDAVKVQVHDADLAGLSVQYSLDAEGDAGLTAVSQNANYDCGTNCAVYEFLLDTTALAQGSHHLTINATDTEGNVARVSQAFRVNNSGGSAAGDGRLLRRTHGAQICVDCHNLPTHSSQSTSHKYGSWAVDCLSCHTPHKTTNVYLIRPQILTPNSGLRDVRFETTAGAVAVTTTPGSASYANQDNASQSDGPCQACHTRTASSGGSPRWRNAASGGNTDTHYTSGATSRCTGCHTHTGGFSGAGGACDSCHLAPPTVGKHGSHDQIGTTPTDYANLAPATTPTQYGFACAKCHSGTHFSDPSRPHTVEVSFDATQDPQNPTGTYTPDGPSQATDPGNNGEGWYWSDGECSNLYCHSNAAPLLGSNAFAIVSWDQAAVLDCTSCHRTRASDDSGGAASDLSDTHGKHIQSAADETGSYAFRCDECHAQTIKDAPADPWNLTSADFATAAGQGKVQHVDGGKDVFFSTTATSGAVDQSGGAYAGSPGHTCSNLYCHSQGTTATAPFLAPNDTALGWNGGTSSCRSCHSGDAGASPTMDSGSHEFHVNNATVLGTNYPCATCHDATVSAGDNAAITNVANHVDGSKDVSGARVDSPYVSPTCTASYCHSSGQAPAASGTSFQYYSMNWNTGPALDCKGCHGRHSENAFASAAGEPNYANDGAGSADANSHARHVTGAADCTKCHNATTANGTQILASAPHTDQARDVVIAAAYDTGDPNYTAATKTCQNVACHGGGSPQWGGTLVCLDCHGGAEGGTLGDGTPNGVAGQWNNAGATGPGHGTPGYGDFASTGGTQPSVLGGCDYCHDLGASHTPTASTNPYRLRFAQTDNTLCLQCHATGDTGIGLNSEGTSLNSINSTKNVDAAHFGAKHSGTEGGKLCWDCHDPHGVGGNIRMVKSAVSKSADAYGVPATTVTINFTDNTTPGQAVGRFTESTNSPRTGMCQGCHDPAGQGGSGPTKYWRSDGTDDPDGPGGAAPIPSEHNAGALCTDCHKHPNAFAGSGTCLDCHKTAKGTGTTARRPVVGEGADNNDFVKQSHHVGARYDFEGTEINPAQTHMGGWLTNFDCVVCHAEGYVQWNATAAEWEVKTSDLYHGGNTGGSKSIDLRDVDNRAMTTTAAGNVFSYNKESTANGGMPSKATPAAWFSANQEWRNQTSTALDPFCLTCHDSNGAATANTGFTGGQGVALDNPHAPGSPAGPTNPFGDLTITNEYDQLNRTRVVNVRDMVADSGSDVDGDGINDPVDGVYARHAIRGAGMAASHNAEYLGANLPATCEADGAPKTGGWDYNEQCTTLYGSGGGGFLVNAAANFGEGPLWNDTSRMGCADCHATDGSNGAVGNAHGAWSEYLLKNADGTTPTSAADEGNLGGSYICFKCHVTAQYDTSHTGGNGSDFQHTANFTGAGRTDLGGNAGGSFTGIACGNCHGGAPGNKGTAQAPTTPEAASKGFGRIHGTSSIFYVAASGSGERLSYRFTNGGSLRYFDPQSWNAGGFRGTWTCYTLSTGEKDSFGGCIQHGGSAVSGDRDLPRPLQY